VSNTLTINSGIMDLAGQNFTIDTLANNSILALDGTQSSQTVTHPDTDSGIVRFKGASGGPYVGTLGFHDFYNLEVNSSGNSFSLATDITVVRDLTIESGTTLDVTNANCEISIGRTWTNNGVFVPRNGRVTFDITPATGGVFHVNGSTTWYIFYCHVTTAGIRIEFQRNRTQTIASGGSFSIQATSWPNTITLTRDNQGDFGQDLDWVPTNPPYTPNAALMWQLNLQPPTNPFTTDFAYVTLYYSDLRATPTAFDPDMVELGLATSGVVSPEVADTCYAWQGGVRVLYSYTEDTDNDGKIDRIRATASTNLNGNFGASPSEFAVEVAGYTIDVTQGTRGFQMNGTNEFFIYLVEKPYTDGEVRPSWRITTNTVLRRTIAPQYLLSTLYTPMVPTDTVRPVISYTLAIPSFNQVFYGFSEPVCGAGGAALTPALFPSASAITVIGSSGQNFGVLSTEGAVVVPRGDIYSGVTRTVSNTINDGALPPADLSAFWAVPPSYPISTPPNALVSTTHRVSDVLISVQPSSVAGAWSQANPDSYFVWPIFAIDQVRTTLTDAQIENLTPAQTAAQGIGLIRAFDGTQWLRDQDWRMQARTNAGVGAPSIIYDSNVEAAFVGAASGLWLPEHEETDFSGIDGFPNAPAYGGDPSGPTAGTTAGANLYEWNFSASDPKVFSVAHFDFWFRIAGAPADLYAGRLAIEADATAIPADWFRRVRPFSLDIHDVTLQKGGVSILNNVIDPTRGDTARISYQLASEGAVTITVFTLDGDVVRRLVNQRLTAGDYATSWDGRNLAGDAVARGVYFVRVVAPGIDEIRKVLVVRR
jgi:hypothetical protein